MKKQLLTILIGASLALPFAAQAQASYVGLNVGRAEQKLSVDGIGSHDDSDTGYKLYGGFEFNKNVGAEIGFVDFGKASVGNALNSVTSKPKSVYIAATGILPIDQQFWLTGKLGLAANRTKTNATTGGSNTDHRTTAVIGIGAAYNFATNLAAVLEYEHFGKVLKDRGANSKADLLSIGLRYKF